MILLDAIRAHAREFSSEPIMVETVGGAPRPVRWHEFMHKVAQARAGLREAGCKRGDRVVVVAQNSSQWAALDVALMCEGLTSVPLYHRAGAEALAFMVRDSEPRLVVVQGDAVCDGLRSACPGVAFSTLERLFAQGLCTDDFIYLRSDEILTIVYTSGTSSAPKGVMLSRANVEAMLPAVGVALDRLMYGLHERERAFHYLPFCFAGSRITLWSCLLRNAELWLSSDIERLADELVKAEPHYVLNVPLVLERIRGRIEEALSRMPRAIYSAYQLADQLDRKREQSRLSRRERVLLATLRHVLLKRIGRRLGSRLRCLISGSAPLNPDTQRWFELIGLPVYQVYGLTETTAIIAMDMPAATGETRIRRGYVGTPIPGADVRVTNQGELLVRGPMVFAGYWRRPEETQAILRGGWLHTGDGVEQTAEGHLKVIGRVNDTIVLQSGHNVAPEPMERELLALLPGASHAVVLGHGQPALSVVISGSVKNEDVNRAIDALNQTRSHYERIRAFVITDEPLSPENGLLTPNLKLRRKAIAERYARRVSELPIRRAA